MKKKSPAITLNEKKIEAIVRNEVHFAKDELREELLDKKTFNEFKDLILTLVDKVLSEIKTFREEMTIMPGRVSEHTEILEDHEVRIAKLETTVS